MMDKLQGWSRRKFGNVLRDLECTRKKLDHLVQTNGDPREIRRLSDSIHELLYKKELLWLQLSRISWLKEGDRNTKFFHSRSVWRARKNKIKKLKDDDGAWQTTPSVMELTATSFFKDLFTIDPSLNADEIIVLIMNDSLYRDFTE